MSLPSNSETPPSPPPSPPPRVTPPMQGDARRDTCAPRIVLRTASRRSCRSATTMPRAGTQR
eukprot:5401133-Prymnesium_polylepis.1